MAYAKARKYAREMPLIILVLCRGLAERILFLSDSNAKERGYREVSTQSSCEANTTTIRGAEETTRNLVRSGRHGATESEF